MALHLHRAERTDLLADGLGAVLANLLADPFAEEGSAIGGRADRSINRDDLSNKTCRETR
jgi:hypothetical protein